MTRNPDHELQRTFEAIWRKQVKNSVSRLELHASGSTNNEWSSSAWRWLQHKRSAGENIDLAANLKETIISFIEKQDVLRALSPLAELLRTSQDPNHDLDDEKVVRYLIRLISTDTYFLEHFIALPERIQAFGKALLNDEPLPPLTEPLPPTAEYQRAQTILAERFQIQARTDGDPRILEGDGEEMKFIKDLPFQNWGQTVSNTPKYTFVARTVEGIQNLVRWAKQAGRKV